MYAKADIEALVEIQNLLYNERYTISGAKQMLARQRSQLPAGPATTKPLLLPQALANLKEHVHELLVLLERMPMT